MGGVKIVAGVRFNPGTSKRFAVVIGSNYVGSRFPYPLRGSENDAHLVADALKASGYEVSLLAGADATHQQIINAINTANGEAGTNGLVLIYYTGFADMDSKERCPRLIPHDADKQSLDATAISSEDITQHYLKDVGNTIILLDCCHSGYLPVDDTFQAGRTCVVMAASALNETSREVEINGKIHGPFTYWLIDHWLNYPGAVDINSMYSSVTQALATSEMSTPVLSGVQTGRIVLRPALSAAEVQEKQPPPPPAAAETRPLVIENDEVVGEVKQDLVGVLAAAFPKRAYLDELADFYLGTTLDAIPTEGNDIKSLIRSMVNWCLIQGGDTLGAFLAGTLKERPKREDLRKVVESLIM